MQHLFINSAEALLDKNSKIVCYLSAEFLMGPHLHNNLVNLGLYDEFNQAAQESGLDLKKLSIMRKNRDLVMVGWEGLLPVTLTP